jgi:hypothetical protein
MSINTWAMTNGYIQCMGCKGFGPDDGHHIWARWNGALMPYCTQECQEADV